jgi:hypothetical protein
MRSDRRSWPAHHHRAQEHGAQCCHVRSEAGACVFGKGCMSVQCMETFMAERSSCQLHAVNLLSGNQSASIPLRPHPPWLPSPGSWCTRSPGTGCSQSWGPCLSQSGSGWSPRWPEGHWDAAAAVGWDPGCNWSAVTMQVGPLSAKQWQPSWQGGLTLRLTRPVRYMYLQAGTQTHNPSIVH